jgi:hypothetical protein
MSSQLKLDLQDQLNQDWSTGLATTAGYAQTAPTSDAAYTAQHMKQMQAEQQMRMVEQEMLIQKAMAEHELMKKTPFDETEEFRDFIVWLCGFTSRSTPPDQEEWDGLTERAKKVAVGFALKTRDRDRKKLEDRAREEYYKSQTTTSAPAYSGNTPASSISGATDAICGDAMAGGTNVTFTSAGLDAETPYDYDELTS